ncbi:MAG: hypothetical protein H7315_14125 [Herminiimonas sp.]|nr:hypothetical protein [Herminiimonas sp.]
MDRFTLKTVVVSLALAANAHAAPGSLRAFEPDSLQQIVAAHGDKPFVLVLWSLDCVYCAASLKTLSEERKRLGNRFAIVTISTDALDDGTSANSMQARLATLGLTSNAWPSVRPHQSNYATTSIRHGEEKCRAATGSRDEASALPTRV